MFVEHMDHMTTRYSYRLRPMSAETTLALEPRHLMADRAGKTMTVPYGDIAAIWLSFMPRGQYVAGFRCKIYVAGARTITLDDSSFTSFFIQEKRSAAYRAFVLELIERVKKANPRAQIMGGRTFWPQAATVTFGLVFGAILPVFGLRTLQAGQWLTGLMFLAFAAGFIAWTWLFVNRNRLRNIKESGIPADLIPPAGTDTDD